MGIDRKGNVYYRREDLTTGCLALPVAVGLILAAILLLVQL